MTRRSLAFAVLTFVFLTCALPGAAQSAKERVTLRTLDRSQPVTLTATLVRPAGAGPFPAMVLLHTCGGLAYLRSRPEIDPKRIGAIGWSHGAGTAFIADTKETVAQAGLPGGGFPASIHIYPGATHAFDNPSDNGTIHVGLRTYTLLYNGGAARDAHDRVLAFLAENMK